MTSMGTHREAKGGVPSPPRSGNWYWYRRKVEQKTAEMRRGGERSCWWEHCPALIPFDENKYAGLKHCKRNYTR
jgi:hypothetical protein